MMIESDRGIRQCSLLNINISVDNTSHVNWKKDLARMIRENFASANIQKYRTIPSVKKKCGAIVSYLVITSAGVSFMSLSST